MTTPRSVTGSSSHGGSMTFQTPNNAYTDSLNKTDYYRSLRTPDYQNSLSRQATTTPAAAITTINRKKTAPVFKPVGKNVNCLVFMLDGREETFIIDKASYGLQLFEAVTQYLDLIEQEYFGIAFREKDFVSWLDFEKKISKQMPPKSQWQFEFRVKFYPPVVDSLMEYLTRYCLCLQVRQDIINGQLRCSFPTYVLLGAYAVQSEAGDHNPLHHIGFEYIRDQPFAPTELQTQEMLEKIVEMHKSLRGQTPEEADRNFLLNATKLALYGVHFYKASTMNNDQIEIGCYHGGLLIYRQFLREMRFSWAKIVKIAYKEKEFQIVIRPSKSELQNNRIIAFKLRNADAAKRVWQMSAEHHAFFRMREIKQPRRPALMPSFGHRVLTVPHRTQQQLAATPVDRPQPRITRKPTQRMSYLAGSPVYGGIGPNGTVVGTSAMAGIGGGGDGVVVALPTNRPPLPQDEWSWSQMDRTVELELDENCIHAASIADVGWQGVRGNKGVKAPGQYYFESALVNKGPFILGWATINAALNPIGQDKNSWGLFYDNNNLFIFNSNDKQPVQFSQQLRVNDIIGCGVEISPDQSQISFYWFVNGTPVLNEPFTTNIRDGLREEALFPAVSTKDSQIAANFGDSPLSFPPPQLSTGAFIPLSQLQQDYVCSNPVQGCVMNPYDSTIGIDVSPNGHLIQSSATPSWQGCRALLGVHSQGRYFYEATPLEVDGLCRIGWSCEQGSLDVGTDKGGWGYGSDSQGFGINRAQGKKLHADEIDNYGEAYGQNDVIGCLIDLDNGQIEWLKNGRSFGLAYSIPHETLKSEAFYPTASLNRQTVSFNFGEKPFKYPPKDEGWLPFIYSLEIHNAKQSRKQGPQRKSRSFAPHDHGLINELQKHPRFSAAERQESIIQRDSPNLQMSLLEKGQTKVYTTSTTVVEKGEPEVFTETYTDKDGNLVTRKVTRMKQTTKIINSHHQETPVIMRQRDEFHAQTVQSFFGSIDDNDDRALNDAILAVTDMNPHSSVIDDGLEEIRSSIKID